MEIGFEKPLILTGHQCICSLCVSVAQTTLGGLLWGRGHIYSIQIPIVCEWNIQVSTPGNTLQRHTTNESAIQAGDKSL